MMRALLAAALLCAALLGATGCQHAPVTGRSQLILVEPAQESALGAKAYQEVLAKSKVSDDAATNAVLQRVGQRIAAQANHPEYQWEFNLLESPEVNAFCLPGGKVAVYTGILPFCRSEAGLAAVMAHEVAHAMARHGAERMSHGMVVEIVASGIQAGTGKLSPAAQAGILQAYGVAATVGAELPFSREQEAEADRIGIELMARAGYVPTEAAALWRRMAAAEKGRGPAFLSTHPATQSRIEALEGVTPQMMAIYRQSRDPLGEGVLLPGAAAFK